jgi:hypothetical protein
MRLSWSLTNGRRNVPGVRFDTTLTRCRISCEGVIEAVRRDVVDLRLDSCGFISIHLPADTGFEYADPESMRLKLEEHVGEDHTGKDVRFGSAIVAERKSGEVFIFVEVLR